MQVWNEAVKFKSSKKIDNISIGKVIRHSYGSCVAPVQHCIKKEIPADPYVMVDPNQQN